MGILGKIARTVIHTATVPIDAAVDMVTFGGVLTDSDSALATKAKKLKNDISELDDEIDKLGEEE